MKNWLKVILMAVVLLTVTAFTACGDSSGSDEKSQEDINNPAAGDGDGDGSGDGDGDVDVAVLSTDFQDNFGDKLDNWTVANVSGDNEWLSAEYSKNKYAQMTAYSGDAEQIDWLISPAFDASGDKITFEFKSKQGYTTAGVDFTVQYSNDYNGADDPNDSTWLDLSSNFTFAPDVATGYGASFTESGEYTLDISEMSGAIYIAFVYSTSAGSTTWQIDDFNLAFGDTITKEVTPDSEETSTDSVVADGSYFSEDFASFPGKMTVYENGDSAFAWASADYGEPKPCASANAYSSGADNADEDWLITPAIDLSSSTEPVLSFAESVNFLDSDIDETLMVKYSTDYAGSGDPSSATWTALTVKNRASGDSNTFTSSDTNADLAALKGESTVYIAFIYKSTASDAPRWNVDTIRVGEPGEATVVEDESGKESDGALFTETFDSALGAMTAFENGISAYAWESANYGEPKPCAKMTAYNTGDSTDNADEDWLITPAIDLSSASAPLLSYAEAINYLDGDSDEMFLVKYSTDYTGSGDPTTATWLTLTVNNRAAGGSWSFTEDNTNADLSTLAGNAAVYIAFVYTSTNADAGTWEIDNVKVGEPVSE